MKPLHIAIAGPVATVDIAELLGGETRDLPKGYAGAPILATLMRELLSRGHRVSAVTLSNDIPLGRESPVLAGDGNFEIRYCPMRRNAWRPNGLRVGRIVDLYAYERNRLREAIEQTAPDIVHAHWTYEFSLAAIASGFPNVVTCHDSPYIIARSYVMDKPTRSLYRWLRVLMARRVLRQASHVTAVSPYIRDEIQPMTGAAVAVVPNPVDAFALEIGRQRFLPARPRIAMVCNGWDTRKNPKPALRAFARLRGSHAGAEFHLYGSDFGPHQAAESWSERKGIRAGLFFHGSLPHKKLLTELAQADLLLHTALEESFGMVIAEAMALGIPVVAGRSSGAVPWVAGTAAELCDVRSESAIHEALGRVLDQAVYGPYSRAGKERVRSAFSAGAVADSYVATYVSALKAAGVPA